MSYVTYPKLRRVPILIGIGFMCAWCNEWDRSDITRRMRYSHRPVCEDCYREYRRKVAVSKKARRDTEIRNDNRAAQREYYWRLREKKRRLYPDPWTQFSRLKLVRIIENAIRAIGDEWEREALAGYYALGMEVAK